MSLAKPHGARDDPRVARKKAKLVDERQAILARAIEVRKAAGLPTGPPSVHVCQRLSDEELDELGARALKAVEALYVAVNDDGIARGGFLRVTFEQRASMLAMQAVLAIRHSRDPGFEPPDWIDAVWTEGKRALYGNALARIVEAASVVTVTNDVARDLLSVLDDLQIDRVMKFEANVPAASLSLVCDWLSRFTSERPTKGRYGARGILARIALLSRGKWTDHLTADDIAEEVRALRP